MSFMGLKLREGVKGKTQRLYRVAAVERNVA